MIPETLTSLSVPVEQLVPYPGNPRRGDLETIKESLSANGQYRPIVANRRNNQVLAGNHTLRAAAELGWTHVAVTWVDVDDEAAARIVLADNRTNDLATYDEAALAELLASLPDFDGTGYTSDFLDALLAAGKEPVALTDPDAVPPLEEGETISHLGDVWQLGEHRLLVGDCTDTAALLSMLGDDRADCVWTDPPYGVNYVGAAGAIKNDTPEGLPELLAGAFASVKAAARPGAPVYVSYGENENVAFHVAMTKAGILLRQHLVWVKNAIVLGRSDYQYKHEPIFAGEIPTEENEELLTLQHEGVAYGFTPGGSGRLGRGGEHWFGDNKASSVFEVPKPRANPDHPTMKPVELITQMLKNSLRPGGLVLDVFGGSGSTLIAAHHLGARAALVELDERYADAICRRFQEHTGIIPLRDGAPVSFAGAE